jgi:AraC-like DNA-binding protein
MDVLSDICDCIRLKSALYFEKPFHGQWGMEMSQSPFGQFHLIVEGSCWAEFEDKNNLKLSTGDLIFFPLGTPHSLAHTLDGPRKGGMEVYNAHINGEPIFNEGIKNATLVCGHFEYDWDFKHPFLENLPKYIFLKKDELQWRESLEFFLNQVSQEIQIREPGFETVTNKLAEILFIQIIREYAKKNKSKGGFWVALNDENIGNALKSIHQELQQEWNLEELAKNSGMSRTSFINRFRELVGMPPMQYITEWRLLKGKDLIVNTQLPIADICERVGYNSEAAFSRAFKRIFGVGPGSVRKNRPKAETV